jgi:arylsulfatase
MARFLEHSASRFVDGKKVGEGSNPMTQAMVFSADDGCDVGEDSGAPVSPDYGSRGNAFNGRVKGVQPSRLAQYSLP